MVRPACRQSGAGWTTSLIASYSSRARGRDSGRAVPTTRGRVRRFISGESIQSRRGAATRWSDGSLAGAAPRAAGTSSSSQRRLTVLSRAIRVSPPVRAPAMAVSTSVSGPVTGRPSRSVLTQTRCTRAATAAVSSGGRRPQPPAGAGLGEGDDVLEARQRHHAGVDLADPVPVGVEHRAGESGSGQGARGGQTDVARPPTP
ncbi:hypothetical protein GCM10020254_03080 [Streptomyces goshikiensis]